MRTDKPIRSDKTLGIIIVCGLLLVVILGVWWFRPRSAPLPAPPPPTRPAETEPDDAGSELGMLPRTRPVVRYREDDRAVQELMRRRKEEHGLEKSVDMIVKPDETLHVGDITIPMKEILDKIRIQSGGLVEEELSQGAVDTGRRRLMERLHEKLAESEKRFWELDAELKEPESDPDAAALQEKMVEHAELGEIVTGYQAYKDTLEEIEARENLLKADDPEAAIRRQLEALKETAAALEADLRVRLNRSGSATELEGADAEGLIRQLTEAENRYWELEKVLRNSAATESPETTKRMIRERMELRELVAGFQEYKRIREKIGETETLLAQQTDEIEKSLQDDLNALRMARNDLEDALISRLLPSEDFEIYGVHVVRHTDNIWNIHFNFLKEYFNARGVRLSPVSDEKDARGLSSGVGKILKFSEKMVYIFNLRERQLDSDLDTIHPLSKIVVFNMGQAFDLLNQINYENIREIRFDGENLWVPAE